MPSHPAVRLARGLATVALVLTAPALAHACGDGEAPTDCGGVSAETGATWMLGRVGAALAADEAGALDAFTRGTRGFRTADTYVFCVDRRGVMSAHPNPALRGQTVTDLHDETGNYFIRAMMERAEAGKVATIRYLFPKPGGTTALPKTTYYTRAGDQVCGVGVYDDEAAVPPASPAERLAQARARLDARLPADLRADWTAFLEALNAEASAREETLTRARAGLQAVRTALGDDR